MVAQLRNGMKITSEVVESASIIIALICMIASGSKIATLPVVKTGLGKLPIWQLIAAVQFVLIVGFLFKLVHKRKEPVNTANTPRNIAVN